MGIIFRSRHLLQITCCHDFTHEDIGSTLNPLPAIVGKGKRILVQLDTVTENTADGGCSYQIVIEALFLQCIILASPVSSMRYMAFSMV